MLATLREVAGAKAADLVTVVPDPAVEAVVGSWPAVLDDRRAADLRRIPDASFESVVGDCAPITLGVESIARSDE
ncbi:hypothetical protein [Streptomyces canus]|uniref:hypothetical protein n=1 Tax=Streptomyces canus TaxID=58343 RepID=UPI002B1D9467|nr:hypothetical protein [Streptomyces canus]